MAHEYSGNIRELENIIEHAFVLCSEGQIEMHHLPEDFITGTHPSPEQGGMNIAFRALEPQMIRQALRRNHYNRAAAARELGMHKSTLFRKIKALGVSLPKRDGRSRSKN